MQSAKTETNANVEERYHYNYLSLVKNNVKINMLQFKHLVELFSHMHGKNDANPALLKNLQAFW